VRGPGGEPDRAHVRLAELAAALSLGIDLGFGQPIEHVLRQCLIALRLADGRGLDDDARADVYYTALLVNVGCHSDAHEQAKWFGDDIALKAGKYDHELRSVRALGAGHPPLHRFRLGLEFALAGHRDGRSRAAAVGGAIWFTLTTKGSVHDLRHRGDHRGRGGQGQPGVRGHRRCPGQPRGTR
jgi:hypothetical protein